MQIHTCSPCMYVVWNLDVCMYRLCRYIHVLHICMYRNMQCRCHMYSISIPFLSLSLSLSLRSVNEWREGMNDWLNLCMYCGRGLPCPHPQLYSRFPFSALLLLLLLLGICIWWRWLFGFPKGFWTSSPSLIHHGLKRSSLPFFFSPGKSRRRRRIRIDKTDPLSNRMRSRFFA